MSCHLGSLRTDLRRLLIEVSAEAQRELAEWENYAIEKLKLEAFR